MSTTSIHTLAISLISVTLFLLAMCGTFLPYTTSESTFQRPSVADDSSISYKVQVQQQGWPISFGARRIVEGTSRDWGYDVRSFIYHILIWGIGCIGTLWGSMYFLDWISSPRGPTTRPLANKKSTSARPKRSLWKAIKERINRWI